MKEEIFLSCFVILFIFNIGIYLLDTSVGFNMAFGLVTGLIFSVLPIVILAGVRIGALTVEYELSDTTIKAISFMAFLFPMLISVNIPLGLAGNIFGGESIPVGLGLLTNMYAVFGIGDFYGIGFIITSLLGIMTIISGVMIALE